MVTQAIKRWLQSLFAWWPWKRSPETDYAHPISAVSKGAASESILRTTVDGSVSQPGATSVAVEHADGTAPPETSRSTPNERPGSFVPPIASEDKPTTPSLTPANADKAASPGSPIEHKEIPAPTFEQQLAYLRYLVRQGVINEGFEQGKEPEQYKHYGK